MNFAAILKGGGGSGNFGHEGRPGEVGGSNGGGSGGYTAAQSTVKQILGKTKKLSISVLDELSTEDLGRLAHAYSTMAKEAPTPTERMSHSATHRAVASALANAERNPDKRTGQRGTNKMDLSKVLKGGTGSGNWAHSGRPGEVGGSGPPQDISSETHEHLRSLGFTPAQTSADGRTGRQYTIYTHDEGTAIQVGPGRMIIGRAGLNTMTGGLMMRGTTEHAPIGKTGNYDAAFIEKTLPTFQHDTRDNYQFMSALYHKPPQSHYSVHKYSPDQFREKNGQWADETEDRFHQPPEHGVVQSGSGVGAVAF